MLVKKPTSRSPTGRTVYVPGISLHNDAGAPGWSDPKTQARRRRVPHCSCVSHLSHAFDRDDANQNVCTYVCTYIHTAVSLHHLKRGGDSCARPFGQGNRCLECLLLRLSLSDGCSYHVRTYRTGRQLSLERTLPLARNDYIQEDA